MADAHSAFDLDGAPASLPETHPQTPPKRRRRRQGVNSVVLDTLRKSSARLERLGARVEEALNAAFDNATTSSDVTILADTVGKFAKDVSAGVGSMAGALAKVGESPERNDNDSPADPVALLSALSGKRKR